MRAIQARTFTVGVFLIASTIAMLGMRYAPRFERLESTAAGDPCSVSCGQDRNLACNPWTQHIAESGYEVDEGGPHGSHEDCRTDLCDWAGGPDSMHPSCLEGRNLAKSGDYEKLKAAVAALDDHTVQQLLGKYPKALVVNAERESIMVVNCELKPIANLPLDREQFGRLVSAP
jgi:hypothetical protein